MEVFRICLVFLCLLRLSTSSPLSSGWSNVSDEPGAFVNLNSTGFDNSVSPAESDPWSLSEPLNHRPNTQAFIKRQDDPPIPPGPLLYGSLTAFSALWKKEDNYPIRRPENFRVSKYSPVNIVTRITPTKPTIPLTPEIASWGLYDSIKAIVALQRWNAATFAIEDNHTGLMIAIINIFDERHPPAVQPTLGGAQNITTPSTLVKDSVLTANERLVVHPRFNTAYTINRQQVFEIFVRVALWIFTHRATSPVHRTYNIDDGLKISFQTMELALQFRNLGDRRNGWLTWEQVGDAWRGMIDLAIKAGEEAGYTPMEAGFMRVADRKTMVVARYRLNSDAPTA